MSKNPDAFDAAVASYEADARNYAAVLIENGEADPATALKFGRRHAQLARKKDAELLESLPAPTDNVVPFR